MALSNYDTPGLSRLGDMQRAPLGQFSALRRSSPVASQYKRQAEMYGQALRTLSRAARRGDAGAAMDAIKVRNQANDEGFTPGGIGRSEDFQGNVAAREQSMLQRNEDLGGQNRLDRGFMGGRERGVPLSRDVAGPSGPVRMPTRNSAALDILEGAQGGYEQLGRGREAAESLGVQDPDSILQGNRNLKYRQTLDSALGEAKSPEEIAALRERGTKQGISPKAFDRRVKWWESNR